MLAYPTWWYAMPAILKVISIREGRGAVYGLCMSGVKGDRVAGVFVCALTYTVLPSPLSPLANPTTNPAMNNKGWIERTFLPHAAFTLPGPGSPPPSVVGLVPQLQNITYVFCVVQIERRIRWALCV